MNNKAKARHVRGHGLHNMLPIQGLRIAVRHRLKSQTKTPDFRMTGVFIDLGSPSQTWR